MRQKTKKEDRLRKKIQSPALRRDQLEEGELPEAVLIKFDNPTIGAKIEDHDDCIAISPASTTFQAQRGYDNIERRILPIILNWTVTVHKLQGTTLDKTVINLRKKKLSKEQTYVTLSRVKTLEGIVLSDLDASKLLNRLYDEKTLTES
ncbi:ATP-dependent DNA helicase PIF1 [Eumeta japonica]|uniref:ATP-dependent DNA helicase PIF1 n=1 Tax=Eumeta variegata TaxID=151549 RepID=A0A4C1VY45_EUMVA|nr:ATP-dependent DNA helicase PIF1 [Eumeta japonica]